MYEILIKSFLRKDCLERLIISIRKYYPDVLIRVCDDGYIKELPFKNVKLYKLPFYSGSSVGKNFLINKCETPYFFICDDDMVFVSETNLDRLLRVLKQLPTVGIASGIVRDVKKGVMLGYGHLEVKYSEKKGREITRYFYGKNAPCIYIDKVKCIPCTMLPNIYMGNKKIFDLYNIKYRDELKRSAHYPFYLDLQDKHVECMAVPDFVIEHNPERPKGYRKFKDNDIYYRMVCERKVHYKRLYEEDV